MLGERSGVKVKICGHRTLEDVRAARGADALGFVVATPASPRNLSLPQAQALMESARGSHTIVLVTTESDPQILAGLVERLEPHALQVHRELSPAKLKEIADALPPTVQLWGLLGIPPDARVKERVERARELSKAPLDALVLDTHKGGRSGGTGLPHDWEISAAVRAAVDLPVVLAGGLTPENVGAALEEVRPWAVDVSSGVERDGRKCPHAIERFLEEVRRRGAAQAQTLRSGS